MKLSVDGKLRAAVQGMLKTRKSAAVLMIGGAVLGFSGPSFAQSNTVGSIFGQVSSGAGSSVSIKNSQTGLQREASIDSDGRFTLSSLPPGHYVVTLLKSGATVASMELEVLAGQGAEAAFMASGDTTEEIIVTAAGRKPNIDVSTTNNGTVFTAEQLKALPIATQNLNGIIGLSQNTVKADSRYSGGISIGGGGPSENAYYVNGFPVTNPLTQLGSMELPFGAIQQAQVQTGGFGAEFGRSVGGVVNIVTKSGTNEWHGGVQTSVAPNSLRASPRNIYYPNTGFEGAEETDGTIYRYRKDDKRTETIYGAYLGGPIIKDKLFFFAAADTINLDTERVIEPPDSSAVASSGFRDSENKNPRYMGKLDWYITDDHRLEATFLGDNYKTKDKYYGYDYETHSKTELGYTENSKNYSDGSQGTQGVGGDAQLFRYVGNVTDNLLITALYGQSKYKHKDQFGNLGDATAPQIFFNGTTAAIDPRLINPNQQVANALAGGTSLIPAGAQETTKSFRFDVEYKLFDHTLRAGIDDNRLKSKDAGEAILTDYFRYVRYPNSRGDQMFLNNQTQTLVEAGATPDADGFYYAVRSRDFTTVTDAQSNQSAQYIEDRWQVTNTVLLTLGLRNEQFENKNGDGETFLKMDDFLSPRLSASWDVFGDATTKIYGSAGRYSLQIPTHVAVRGASRSTLADTYFVYTGVDPVTGAPTGLTQIADVYSANNEYGQAKDPRSVASQNIDPTYQDEFTLGFEQAFLTSYTGGVSLTYRKLKATIDDFCDYRPIDAYAEEHGIDLSKAEFYPFGCATINPGKGNTIYLDPDGADDDEDGVDEEAVAFDLSAADIGLPKPKRTYTALNFFLEHPFRDKWYGKLMYTWAKSKGNTEGQTKSDNGQSDVAVTSTWDFPELMEGANGYLPSDRRHTINGFGYYQVAPEWAVGGAFRLESGRPKNCFGDYAGDGEDIGGGQYGAVFFYCGDGSGDPDGAVATPRGSAGRLPWSYTFDLNVVYQPKYVDGLTLRADVFNLFNRQSTSSINEEHDSVINYGGLNSSYGRVISYTDPRVFRLTASYEF